jgi:hypothetical protein
MKHTGNIKKMAGILNADGSVTYGLPIGDATLQMNPLIGQAIRLTHQQTINCIACGRETKKSFAQGYCYPCFRSLAACDMCVMKPETCHYAEGTCREPEWGDSHCFIPHYVYLANSSGIKVGITRETQVPTRWIDQGATQALPIFEVSNRLQSGLIEVALKKHVSDRTDWRKMLKGDAEALDLVQIRDDLMSQCADDIAEIAKQQGSENIRPVDESVLEISYPVDVYPDKVKSFNFDKQAEIEGVLQGIKGQYLILDSGVLNIRKFTGYNIDVEIV